MANAALDPHAAIATTASGVEPRLTTADGKPLARALARSQRRARRRAILLVLPLLAFILITFVVP
ncbi:MAG: ABC transporter permease, partial [Paracoccus sp. (in: a-proteobacteria)]